ncbi:MAG TPA: hypothetical protein VF942_05765 [Acidimicrobiales bacterium]
MRTRRSGIIAAAFDRGQIPTIACFNQATVPLGVDFDKLVATLQQFLDQIFVPVWGTPASLVKTTGFRKGAWALAFLDAADVANALGYHDLTPDGLPLSKVFVRTTLGAGQKVSVTAGHELAEMMVDPAINLCSTGPNNRMYAYETADAVEEEEFQLNGVALSDFVYPSWFEIFRKPGSTRFDHLNKVNRPFQILPGGYMPVFVNGKWTQIFGSKAKAERFAREDRRGHRSTYRGRANRMKPSRRRG